MGRATTPVAVLYPRGRRAGTQSDEAHIGQYELIGEIGRGGMGTVYLAGRNGHAGFRRLSALKLMHRHLAEDSDFLTMFLDEARIAARIHHANVVSILDLDMSSRGYFVVMDYVEGCSLAQLLARSPSHRTPRVLARIVVDFLLGLHAAHSLRDERDRPLELVHRDVSPANVLVGVDGVARITDFGVAKARARIASTQPGVHKGTLSYASPEQLRATRLVDARTDVWASGVLLWNSLTGRSLFRGDSDAQTVHRIMKRQVPPPSRIGLKPPAYFDGICSKALDRDVSKRFQSAEEMADALQEVASRHGVLGTQREIGMRVVDSFSLEFAARRKAIRDAERRQGAQPPSSLVPELPDLATPVQDPTARADGAVGAWPASRSGGSRVAVVAPAAASSADWSVKSETSPEVSEYEELQVEFVPAGAPAVMSERSARDLVPRRRGLGRVLHAAMVLALVAGAVVGAVAYDRWNLGGGSVISAAEPSVQAVSAEQTAVHLQPPTQKALESAARPSVPQVAAEPEAVPATPTLVVKASPPPVGAVPAAAKVAPAAARAAPAAAKREATAPPAEQDRYKQHLEASLRAQRLGRLGEALDQVERALAVRRTGRGFQVKADILMERGEAAGALAAANSAVALAPSSAKAWLTKGMLHYELRDYPSAKNALEHNLRLSPNGRNAETIRVIVEEL